MMFSRKKKAIIVDPKNIGTNLNNKLRMLWLTNILMPDLAMSLGQTPSPRGGWTVALADALVESGRVETIR